MHPGTQIALTIIAIILPAIGATLAFFYLGFTLAWASKSLRKRLNPLVRYLLMAGSFLAAGLMIYFGHDALVAYASSPFQIFIYKLAIGIIVALIMFIQSFYTENRFVGGGSFLLVILAIIYAINTVLDYSLSPLSSEELRAVAATGQPCVVASLKRYQYEVITKSTVHEINKQCEKQHLIGLQRQVLNGDWS